MNQHGDGGEASESDGEDEEYGRTVERDTSKDQEWVRFARGGRRDFAHSVPVVEFKRFAQGFTIQILNQKLSGALDTRCRKNPFDLPDLDVGSVALGSHLSNVVELLVHRFHLSLLAHLLGHIFASEMLKELEPR